MDDHHRLHVLESRGDDPAGPYHFRSALVPPHHTADFAIDPSVFTHDGHLYLAYSGINSYQHNGLNIAPLSNPYTVSGATAAFSFTGTRIALLSVRDTGNGVAAISVDGGAERRVDLYGAIRTGETLQYVSPRLPSGRHTVRVRVRVTGEHDDRPQGSFVSIDQAEVYTH